MKSSDAAATAVSDLDNTQLSGALRKHGYSGTDSDSPLRFYRKIRTINDVGISRYRSLESDRSFDSIVDKRNPPRDRSVSIPSIKLCKTWSNSRWVLRHSHAVIIYLENFHQQLYLYTAIHKLILIMNGNASTSDTEIAVISYTVVSLVFQTGNKCGVFQIVGYQCHLINDERYL